MKKSLFIFFLFSSVLLPGILQAQSTKDLYFEYLQVRMDPDKKPEAINQALLLLKHASELNGKQIANLTYHLGRLYEEREEMDKAIPYYEQSIKLSPGYFVAYRALGFYYIQQCNEISDQMKQAAAQKNASLHADLYAKYKTVALKALPCLEKSQACDPDEETLFRITNLYKSIKDTASLTSLDDRLKKMASDCVTLLDDE